MASQIAVDDIVIDVVRKDIRNLRLTVYSTDGRVRIAAPLRVHDDAVRVFAVSKLRWIRTKLEKFKNQPRPPEYHFVSGEDHPYFGRLYPLNVIDHTGWSKVELGDNGVIKLYIPPGAGETRRQKALNEWYRQSLKLRIPLLIQKWQPTIGVKLNDWRVKKMKTRWGSCNIKARRIWLNLELAKNPEYCLEYVVVHEMVHLLERRHNHRFTAYMDEFLPRWRRCRAELGRGL